MDFGRNEASAFGSASLTTGSLLPFEGRSLMMRPEGLPAGAENAQHDTWLSPENPLLVRGEARILPLAWSGDGSAASPQEITAFAAQLQAAAMQWAGNWRNLDLTDPRDDSIGSYTAALRAADASRVDCWTYSETIGVALVWAGDENDGTGSLALHIIPVSWVSEPRVKGAVSGIDVRWSWVDVIALHATRITQKDARSL